MYLFTIVTTSTHSTVAATDFAMDDRGQRIAHSHVHPASQVQYTIYEVQQNDAEFIMQLIDDLENADFVNHVSMMEI